MKRMRDLMIDGLLLALPVVVVALLLQTVVGAIVRWFAPVSHLLPQGRWFGIAAVDVAALCALALALALIGAFAHTRAGRVVSHKLEDIVLRKIPGYLLFKSVVVGFSSEERESGLTPALISFDDNTVLGFIVEQSDSPDGLVTVFIPAAPTPAAGSVVLVPRARVTVLQVPVSRAMHAVSRLGLGLQQLTSLPSGSEHGQTSQKTDAKRDQL